jgi:hypothetical protein
VLVAALLLPAALAADSVRPSGSARAALAVSATVVRSPAPAEIVVRGGAILVRNPGGIRVTVEGGVVRPAQGFLLRVEPVQGGITRITLTY